MPDYPDSKELTEILNEEYEIVPIYLPLGGGGQHWQLVPFLQRDAPLGLVSGAAPPQSNLQVPPCLPHLLVVRQLPLTGPCLQESTTYIWHHAVEPNSNDHMTYIFTSGIDTLPHLRSSNTCMKYHPCIVSFRRL